MYICISRNHITEVYYKVISWRYITADRLPQIYYGRYIRAHIYYGRYMMADILRQIYCGIYYGVYIYIYIYIYYGRCITTIILRQIYDSRYITADILRQIYYGRYITADILRQSDLPTRLQTY